MYKKVQNYKAADGLKFRFFLEVENVFQSEVYAIHDECESDYAVLHEEK